MESYLQEIIAALEGWNPIWTYAMLGLSAFLENILPPVPGDAVVVFSAYLVGRGVLGLEPVYLTTWVGGTAGFMVMYYIGRTQGRRFLQGRAGRLFAAERLAKVHNWLQRYGLWLVVANRFLSGVRSVIALAAGSGGLAWRPVLLAGGLSMAVWNGLLLYAGLLVGQNWAAVIDFLGHYNRVLIGALVLLGGLWAWRAWRRRQGLDSQG
ncbi:MAG: DedA family protein [Candidatus Latescibacteria bacterium]|nr:DedA family protein [Candidatus Latescibacterota bacterium]